MCPLTTEATCLVVCVCVCFCCVLGIEPYWFLWDVWCHAALPDFLSRLPVSCSYFIQISTHVYIHAHTPVWGCELQRVNDMLWSLLRPQLCLMTVCVAPRSVLQRRGGGDRGCSLGNEWTVQMCTTERTIPFSMLQLLSPSMSFWLYQFLVQTVAPRGSEVWSYTAAEGTVTQRPLKISEGQLSVRDQMSGMEWGCKTIYGGLWLLCKHGRDERTENRGGQKSHDSETGGGVRIRKAIMITDQSQTPEAGARQVVYTH